MLNCSVCSIDHHSVSRDPLSSSAYVGDMGVRDYRHPISCHRDSTCKTCKSTYIVSRNTFHLSISALEGTTSGAVMRTTRWHHLRIRRQRAACIKYEEGNDGNQTIRTKRKPEDWSIVPATLTSSSSRHQSAASQVGFEIRFLHNEVSKPNTEINIVDSV